jgi:hypothetical protein
LLTIDRATAVVINNGTGLPLPADPRNAVAVAGTFNPLTSSFVADGGRLVLGTPVTVPSAGGNLNVAGTGAFAGAVDMGGNQINHLANGTVATDAATVGQVASSIPTVDYGRFSLGIGVGSFKGKTAASLGAS